MTVTIASPTQVAPSAAPVRHRVRRSIPTAVLAVPLLVVTAVVHAVGAGGAPGYADDEGTYVAQAFAVRRWHELAHYTYWYDHPPLGWIQLAGWQTLLSPLPATTAVATARELMVVLAVLDTALVVALARRLGLGRGWALAAAAAWTLSPLALGLSRQVYLDGIGLPWALGALVLAASPRRSLWAHTGAGLCLAMAALSKETLLLLAPAVLWLMLRHSDKHTRSFSLAGLCSGALVVLAYPLLAVLKGELLPGPGHVSLTDALRFQLWSRPSNGDPLTSGTTAHGIVAGWWQTDPWLMGALLLAVPAVLVPRLRPVAVTVVVLVLSAVRPGYLPQPYVIALLPLGAVCAAGVLDAAVHRCRAAWPRRGVVVALTAGLALAAGPAWARADGALMHQSQVGPERAAEAWLIHHADRRQRVLVDDTMWVDLVSHGMRRDRVIWLYKLDFVNNLDPSVARVVSRPHDLGYLVVTPIVRSTLAASGSASYGVVRSALADSRPVATFGSGSTTIEIRQVRR